MTNYDSLTKIFSVLSILLFAAIIAIDAQTTIYTLEAGTKFRVRMDNEINSKVSSINDTFTVTIIEPVVVKNVELIAAGAVIEGKILSVKPASAGNSDGIVKVKFQTLRLPDNETRSIDASLVNENILVGKQSSFAAVSILSGSGIGAILGAIIGKGKGALIGAGLGAGAGATTIALKKGRESRIKANEEFEIRLNKEVTLPIKDF